MPPLGLPDTGLLSPQQAPPMQNQLGLDPLQEEETGLGLDPQLLFLLLQALNGITGSNGVSSTMKAGNFPVSGHFGGVLPGGGIVGKPPGQPTGPPA